MNELYEKLQEIYNSKFNRPSYRGGQLPPLTRDIIEIIVDRNPTKFSDLDGIKGFPLDGWRFRMLKGKFINDLGLIDDLPKPKHIYSHTEEVYEDKKYTRKKIDRMKEERYKEYFELLRGLENSDSEDGKQKTTEDGRTSSELLLDIIAYENIPEKYYDGIQAIISKAVSENGVRPYQVFGNKEILTLLYYRPGTLQELEGLKGFPKDGARATKYGKDIVGVFNPNTSHTTASDGMNYFK